MLAFGPAAARPHVMAMGVATILNSGSTNSSGYTVRVFAGGQATVAMKRPATSRTGSIPRKMASDLFAAIHASQSGGRSSREAMCIKSVSFGSSMSVQYGNWKSVDLNCPVTGANAALKAEVNEILAALKVQAAAGPRPITLPTNEPRAMEPTAQPSKPPSALLRRSLM